MGDKNRTTAAILALITGIIGGHKFYLGDTKKGIIYLLFSWTAIPFVLGLYSGVKFLMMDDKEFDDYVGSSEVGSTSENSDNSIMEASGRNGQLTLYENKIRISRKGIVSTITNPFKGDKEIMLNDITSIQFREPGMATTGYIQIGQSGYSESDDGLFDATSDENSITFAKDALDDFQEIREEIDRRRTSDIGGSGMDSGMEKLREKYANGEITEKEYKERKQILDEV
jgi:TM2 domain-containing membrane protein YozV